MEALILRWLRRRRVGLVQLIFCEQLYDLSASSVPTGA
jgi:hypothetical protein